MRRHRVSMLGSLRRRPEDPASSSDPQIRAVVERLQAWDYAPAPRPEFRDELRAQLVAVTERVITESADSTPAEPRVAARRRRSFARPVGIAATVAAALVLLLVGAVFISQRALPGDSLYGLKRASEDVRISVTSGDTDRGHAYLAQAQTRVQEAQDLLGRTSALGGGVTAGGVSPQTQALISAALVSSDKDLATGWNLLRDQATSTKSVAPVDIMIAWAGGQQDRLQTLVGSLPSGGAQDSANVSLTATTAALRVANATAQTLK